MILVAVGVIALLVNLGWLGGDALLRLLNLWPLILVVLGLSLVWRSSVSEPGRAAVLELATVSLAFLGAIAYAVTGPALPSASSQSLDSSTAIGAASQARLDLNAGAGKITLQSGDLGSDLYQAHLTYPGGDTPNITFDRSTAILHISFPNRNLNFGFVNQQRTADIRLS